jgi:REP element-mobilizing transposase RayT
VTAPRQLIEGSTYFISHRCSERRLFLRPTPSVNATFGYLLAVAADRHGIRIHAFCVMSNHFHLLLTDPHARLPDFHRDLDSLLARALNRLLGRRGDVLDREAYNAVRLEDRAAVLDKLVYALANPVAAGLARRGSNWPGLWSAPDRIGGAPYEFHRPEGFFRKNGPLPGVARLQLERPPGFEEDAAFTATLLKLLQAEEDAIAKRLEPLGHRLPSAATLLSLGTDPRALSPEAPGRIRPRVAARDPEVRRAALRRLADFGRDYRDALLAWRRGVRHVLFPEGTWLMRVRHAAACNA